MTDDASAPSDAAAVTPAPGIHHVTAIVGPAQRALDFYAGGLGLRLVKRTVNFDDPGTWHFYFGDTAGAPGSIFTVFPWALGPRGRIGTGQVGVTAFAVPPASLGWWLQRLVVRGVKHSGPHRRFPDADGVPTESYVSLEDEDGLLLELVGDPRVEALAGWAGDDGSHDVPPEHAIRGLFGVQLWLDDAAPTAALLGETLGFRPGPVDGVTARWLAPGDPALGRVVDLRAVAGFWKGRDGAGAVHHVAFRAADDAAEQAIRAAVMRRGLSATPTLDREYFRSVYFREPGGVLFEIATDAPGFAVDEPPERLGHALMLPARYEARRAEIARALAPVAWPPATGDDAARASAFHALPPDHDAHPHEATP